MIKNKQNHADSKQETSSNIRGGVYIYISLFMVSLIIVFATLYFPKTFNDPNKLLNIACGLPFSFLTFSSSRSLPDHSSTDSCIRWLGEGWFEGNVQFLWLSFIMNITAAFGLLVLVFHILNMANAKK
jgi:hypothetical protein